MTTPETAVSRCLKAYYDKAEIENPHDTGVDAAALDRIRLAYRHTMPYLLPDRDSIDAFIACVTHGLVIHVFEPAEASKLLYAAQVTLGSLRARHEAAHQQSKSPQADTPTPLPRNHSEESQPQPSRAPSMATASSSPWVGDHEPQPTVPGTTTPTPLPEIQMAPVAPSPSPLEAGDGIPDTPAAPAPQAPPTPLPPSQMAAKPQSVAPQVPRNQVDILLDQLFAGKLPAESPLTPCAAVLNAAPPTPSPLPVPAKPQSAAPQVPPPPYPKGENTLLRAAS